MKKLKKIQLKLEKEVISTLNNDNLSQIKGGDDVTSKRTACFRPTVLSDCCGFASNGLCYTENQGNCATNNNGCASMSVGRLCCAPEIPDPVTVPVKTEAFTCINVLSEFCAESQTCAVIASDINAPCLYQ